MEASRDRYDVIVVGGGVGGLAAGGLLASAGRAVLVLEAESAPGGFARSFESLGCSFDLADHLIMGCRPGGPFGDGLLHQVLDSLGVAERVDFVPVDPFHAVHFQGERHVIPAGREAHVEALARAFPAEARGVRALFQVYDRAYRELAALPIRTRLRDAARIPLRFPVAFRRRRSTLDELLREHVRDPRLRTIHTALWPYIGLPPSRASALAWGMMVASYAGEGAFYPVGGYQRLADALAEGLRRRGGELVCGERVAAIRAEGGRVIGVTTARGAAISAPTVIAGMDPREALGPMLDGAAIPGRYRRGLERRELSISVHAMYLAVDLDIDPAAVAHETVVTTVDGEEAYTRGKAGDVRMVLVTTPTLTDRGRSRSGRHTVVVKTLCPDREDSCRRDAIAAAMLELAGRAIPGLRDGVVGVHGRNGADPWPLHRLGPIYGWAVSPDQLGRRRLGHDTPVAGLHLVGHWSQPAAGVWGAAASAVQLARILLGRDLGAGLAPIRL